jgi:hypothetical protein
MIICGAARGVSSWMLSLCIAALAAPEAVAEPYLAAETGYQRSQCHVNPTGGGLRNAFGDLFSQTQLPANLSEMDVWNGTVLDRFSIGSDARGSGRQFDFDDRDDHQDFEVDSVVLYLNAILNEHVSFYVDEQVAPGGSLNRQAWAMLKSGNWYLKGGKLVLPFGLRFEDDSAFVREVTGINFDSADNGVEAGYVGGAWSAQLSVTNGTAGAAEVDDGKQGSVRVAFVQPSWRIGVSGNYNHTDPVDRTMYGLFGGLRTGPVSWLAEYDRVDDDGLGTGDLEQDVALLEASIRLRKGHYLQLVAEMNSFDDSDLQTRYRYSAVYAYFPWPFTEFRGGYRQRDSNDDAAAYNASESFVQVHVYF